ncbi:unannotated protein [freshwater metagenome]|uniref:Unannotated protein n=1 Tax=freshwater metagenome TaxID=449393 RepID=A0A6J7ICZ7_9ZZZZ|nr:polysaccharide deacetylase family protein [Actinomycetota bacterium]
MRLRTLTIAALATASVLPAAAAQAASTGGALHALQSDGTPVELQSVALGQVNRDLVLTVRATRSIDPADFDDGGRICLHVRQMQEAAVICVTRSGTAWRLRRDQRALAGVIGQPKAGILRVRWRPADVGLEPGSVSWRVAATPDGCDRVALCRSRAPRESGTDYPGRVMRVSVVGCVASGPTEVRRGAPGKRIALTYDDGPSADTAALLDTLQRLDVPATFFMIGRQVEAHADVVRRVLAEGHEIGNHSWDHADLGRGGARASRQLRETNAVIQSVTGYTPCVFRPPYGSTGPDLVERTRAAGLTSILWSVDPLDWKRPGADHIVARVLRQTGPGAIILSHDGGGPRAQTLAAAPRVIAGLRRRGYTFVTVSELLGYRERLELRP